MLARPVKSLAQGVQQQVIDRKGAFNSRILEGQGQSKPVQRQLNSARGELNSTVVLFVGAGPVKSLVQGVQMEVNDRRGELNSLILEWQGQPKPVQR